MARRSVPLEPGPARLTIPRTDARQRLDSRIQKGGSLLEAAEHWALEEKSADWLDENRKWSQYNSEMLRRIFSTDEYQRSYDYINYLGSADTFGEFVDELRKQIRELESITERLDLIDEAQGVVSRSAPAPTARPVSAQGSRDVFVVHGREKEALAIVARFLERCDLRPVILHEQSDGGQTIIEKFERNAGGVAFAVVLLTPDDVGGLKPAEAETSPALQARARQNVILELGYFVGRLGRDRVCALKRGSLEIPSDYVGVVYIDFDASEAWKMKLARELRSAGIDIDLNKALG